MTTRLDPKDYYSVRFVKPADPDTHVTTGFEGVVIEHLPSMDPSRPENYQCIVEVAPWDENGEPLVVVDVPRDHVERVERAPDEQARLRINQRWEDMDRWHAVQEANRRSRGSG